MPYFLIVPIWLLCVMLGMAALIIGRFRYLSLYLMIASTLGLAISLIASTGYLFLSAALLPRLGFKNLPALGGFIMLGGYLALIGIGAAIGIVCGVFVAAKLNSMLGWRKNSNRDITRTTVDF